MYHSSGAQYREYVFSEILIEHTILIDTHNHKKP